MRELYKNLLETKKIRVDDVPAILKEYLFGERILELPRPIKKALRYHEKTFLKVLVLLHLPWKLKRAGI